jgi:hypothetical protein
MFTLFIVINIANATAKVDKYEAKWRSLMPTVTAISYIRVVYSQKEIQWQ